MDKVMYEQNLTAGGSTDVAPSPAVWKDCQWLDYALSGNAVRIADHFVDMPHTTTSGTAVFSGGNFWYPFAGTGGSITRPSGTAHIIDLNTGTTANTEAVLGWSATGPATGGTVPAFVMAAAGNSFWYEARIRLASAALAQHGIFVGLAGVALAVADGILADTTGEFVAGCSGFGFHVAASSTTATMNARYVVAGAAVTVAAAIAPMALNTWYKLGMRYIQGDDRLRYYVNGLEVGSVNLTAAGSAFPVSVSLLPYFVVKNHEAAAKRLQVDWVRAAQVIP